jgi:hypothetical protein
MRDGTVRVSGMTLPPELVRDLYRVYMLERVPAVEPPPAEGEELAIRLTAPDPGDAGLETTTPVFRWTPIPDLGQYSFVLERFENAGAGRWIPVEGVSGQTTAPERVLPPEVALLRGSHYRWRVEAIRGEESLRSPTVKFRVLSEGDARRLNEARDRYGNVPFLLGPQYEALGLHEEAIWEYLKLTRVNPASPQAQRALENAKLRADRHRKSVEP